MSKKTRLGTSVSKEDKCGICLNAVLAKDTGLQCEVCDVWFHTKCAKITDDAYVFLEKNETMHWYCKECDKGMVKMLQSIKRLENRQDKVESDLTEIKQSVVDMKADIQSFKELVSTADSELKQTVMNIKTDIQSFKELVSTADRELKQTVVDMKADIQSIKELASTADIELKQTVVDTKADIQSIKELASTTDTKLETMIEAKLAESLDCKLESSFGDKVKVVKEDVAESMEIEMRKTNLIFYGVKECDVLDLDYSLNVKSPDQEKVEEVMKAGLRIDASRHIDDVQRIGRFVNGKVRPLRVKVKSFEARSEIMKRAKNLRDNDTFKNIYITPDLTRKQQAVDKELREKLRKFKEDGVQNVKIRYGKIIKNGEGSQVKILYQPAQN